MRLPQSRWVRIPLGILVVLLLGLGIFLITPLGQDVLKIARLAPSLQKATITQTELFTPQVTIGEQCAARPLVKSDQGLSPDLVTAIEQAQKYSDQMQGVGLIILQDGQVLHESYSDDSSEDTWVRSFSMQKSLVALVVGLAIEKGAIGSIEEPVSNYIPEWEDDPRGQITLKQLLNMESGIEITGPTTLAGIRQLLGNDINALILDKELATQPGAQFAYNNASSQILGLALDRALQAKGLGSYADFFEANLWCAAGNDEAALWFDSEDGTARYYSGLFTDLPSWARIGEMIRNDGAVNGTQVVASDWLAAMKQPSPTNPNYGLHVWIGSPEDGQRRYNPDNPIFVPHSAPYLADDVLFFDGFGGQRVYVVPSAGLTIVRSGEVNLEYDDAIIVNLILGALSPE